MTRRRRWALAAGLTIVGLITVLLGVATAALTTQVGSRWILGKVPGLEVEGFEGRLGGHWQADRLSWAGAGGLKAEVIALGMTWTPGCLWRLTLCVDHLHAEQVNVTPGTPVAATESNSPFQLPDLDMPVSLELGEVHIGQVNYAGQPLLSQVNLAANWGTAGLQLRQLQMVYGDMRLGLEGTLRPQGQWPMDAQLSLALPTVDKRAWQLQGTLKGEVASTLALAAKSTGYLDATLAASLQPLADHLPAQVVVTAERFTAEQSLPATLTLQQIALKAEGNLKDGYAVRGDAHLPGEQGVVTLLLKGNVSAEHARVDELSLAQDATHRVQITGNATWADGLAAEANLDWLDFPWASLYPQPSPPPVSARNLKATVRYGHGNYVGNLAGDFQGPAGPFTFTTPFSGDTQRVVLPQLQLVAGQGQLAGQLKLGFAEGLFWGADLSLSNLNPAYWVAAMPGKLGGTLTSEGRWENGILDLAAQFGITGQLRGQPANAKGSVNGKGSQWQVAGVDVGMGLNHLTGSGRSSEGLEGMFAIAAPRLDQLWPGLAGAVKGQLNLAGSLVRPQGKLVLQGQQLAWQDNRIRGLSLDAQLDGQQQGTLNLTGIGLAAGTTSLGTLSLKGNGDAKRHSLQAGLEGPELVLALTAAGSWLDGAWKGQLSSSRIASHGQAWALQSPASLQRLADGTVTLGAHCWRSGRASLCADNQQLAPEPRIRLHLNDFPMASLQPWLPDTLSWEGSANADVKLDMGKAGPQGQLKVDISGGTLSTQQGTERLRFPYDTLRLVSNITPRNVDNALDFEGRRLGQLHVKASVDPFGAQKALSGSFSLGGLDLAILQPMIEQADQVAGQLDGSGQLGGTLQAPRIDGLFNLANGRVSGPGLPLSIEALNLQARMGGDHLELEGGWRSGAQGQGTIAGELDWSQALRLDMAVRASQLPVDVPPYAQVEAGADLRLVMANQKLAVSGTVNIPKGTVTVRQLPPSTVKVSQDTIVVGREAPASVQAGMAMDINVIVGEEKLAFSGFGLQADITGRLHIGNDLDTRGALELRNGRYRAYGQRLTIRRARLFFTGPVDQPYLDVEAVRQTDDVTAGIRLSGSVQQPSSEVFAEPAMSQEQALSWLILGRPLNSDGGDNNVLAQAALGLGLMGSASTAGTLAKNLGIQDFQLDTQGSGNTTSVVASGNLTDRLTLRYGVGVFEPASTVALRYALTRQLYLEAASGVASSLDLFYKKDF